MHCVRKANGTGWAPPASAAVRESPWSSNQFNRSEEHTSELQSPCNLVCRLLLEKKKKSKRVQSSVKAALYTPVWVWTCGSSLILRISGSFDFYSAHITVCRVGRHEQRSTVYSNT